MKKLVYFLLGTFISLDILAADLPDFPFVTVSGTATREVEPDKGIMTFYIAVFDESSEQGNRKLNNKASELVKMLFSYGLKSSDITSYEIRKESKRKRDKDYNQLNIIGYDLRQKFTIRLKNLDRFIEIYESLLNTGNAEGIETRFYLQDRERIETELVSEAAADARRKAEVMAKGLGVEIDSVFAFNDSHSYDELFTAFFKLNRFFEEDLLLKSRRSNTQINIFIPKYIRINKTVNVIYKVDN